jgi:hypothetical protein
VLAVESGLVWVMELVRGWVLELESV